MAQMNAVDLEIKCENGEVDTKNLEPEPKNKSNGTEANLDDRVEDGLKDEDYVFSKTYTLRKREAMKQPVYKEENIIKIEYNSEAEHTCGACGKIYSTRKTLRAHERKHHATVTFKCAICHEEFASNKLLIKHKTTHENMTFVCKGCKEAFSDHCDYLLHKLEHQSSTYRCPECTQTYQHRHRMHLHIQSHFVRTTPCEICYKQINSAYIGVHMQSHGTSKPCVECGKMYSATEMKYHMYSHTGERPYQCLYCGKGFIRSQQRNIHTRTHTGERPHACEQCPRRFKQSTDLIRHVQAHHSKEKYECDVCHKKFLHKVSIESHMSTHFNNHKFRCALCGVGVASPAARRAHMLFKHTEEKLHACEPCGMRFKLSSHLKRHLSSLTHQRAVYGLEMAENK